MGPKRLALLALSCLGLGLCGQAYRQYPQELSCPYADRGRLCTADPSSGVWILQNGPIANQEGTGNPVVASNGTALTVSRASNAYCQDSTGVLHLLSSNQPCLEPNGLRVEGSSTNLVLQSVSLTNASWRTQNVTVATSASAGPDNGTAFDLKAVASPTGPERIFQAVTLTATPVTYSIYAKAGAWSFIGIHGQSTTEYITANVSTCGSVVTAGGALGAATVVGGYCRVTMTETIGTGGTINPVFQAGDTAVDAQPTGFGTGQAAGAVLVTFAKPQAEQQAFASSPIDTTTTSATRAADNISLPNPLSAASPLVVGATVGGYEGFANNSLAFLVAPSTYGAANTWGLYVDANGTGTSIRGDFINWDNSAVGVSISSSTYIAPAGGDRLLGTDFAGALTIYRGGSVKGTGSSNGLSANPATISIGSLAGGEALNGWLHDICLGTSTSGCTP